MSEISPYALLAIVLVSGVVYWWYRYKKPGSSKGSGSGEFVSDLTQAARDGELDPVIGREDEVDRVIHIVARRTKNNPLLIGPPGVGKTAIVEGLAIRIANDDVPDSLKDKQVLSLSLGELISGTSLRGEFEKRFQKLIERLENLPGIAILFIDEIHMIDQAKGSEGGLNLADMIKPPLARGELSVIGATTWHEYSNSLKKDDALDRRFQPILVGEPEKEDALVILNGLRSIYEEHHGVKFDDDALEAAVELSFKNIHGRYLPDKAIDVIDEAAAKVSIEASVSHKIPLAIADAAAKKASGKDVASGNIPNVTKEDIEEIVEAWKDYPEDSEEVK